MRLLQNVCPPAPRRRRGACLSGVAAAAALAAVLMVAACGTSVAGWQQVGGGELSGARCLAADPFVGAIVYACGSHGQVYRWRADKGNATVGGEGLPDNAQIVTLTPDTRSAGLLYVGTSAGFYVSEDRGDTWHARNTGLPQGDSIDAIAAASGAAPGQTSVFAGTPDRGVYVTADEGRSWAPVNSGLPSGANVDALLWEPASRTLFVSLDQGGVFALPAGIGGWSRRGSGLPGPALSITSTSVSGRTMLFAGTSTGLFGSDDGGENWSAISGLPTGNVGALASTPTHPGWLCAGVGSAVYRSQDAGRSWASVASPLPGNVGAVLVAGSSATTVVFAAADHVYRNPALVAAPANPFETLLSLLAVVAAVAAAVWALLRTRRQMPRLAPTTRTRQSGNDGRGGGTAQADDTSASGELPQADGPRHITR